MGIATRPGGDAMSEQHCECAVVGGGVSGLATAFYLHKYGCDVRLLEKEATVGGCMRTLRQDGFLLEQGPFNVLVRDPAFQELLDDLAGGLEVEQANASSKKRYLYLDGRLVPLPSGPVSLVSSRFLSARGKLRLLAEPLCSRKPTNDDPTISDFATRHFGHEFAANVLGAFVRGVFGGDSERLSLKACFPSLAALDRDHRSLLLYGLTVPFRRIGKPKKPRRRWKGLVNFSGGLGALSDAIARRLDSTIETGCAVSRLICSGDGCSIEYSNAEGAHLLQADQVILATPVEQAARLIGGMDGEQCSEVGRLLASIESIPMVILNLGFRREDVGHDLGGFGFLVPPREKGISFLGVLWASSIFPSHAPPGHHLIRVFLGGAEDAGGTGKSDDELVALAMEELTELLHLRGRSVLQNVCRYAAAIPQYYRGHCDTVRRIRQGLASIPNLQLVGNYLDGVSINDCVRSARNAASEIAGAPAESMEESIA